MITHKNHTPIVLSFFIILLTIVVVYDPGITGSFILDDEQNLSRVNDYGGATNSQKAFFSYIFGGTGSVGRPISVLSFLINDNAWPGDPSSFKFTNLLIHILNSILVFILSLKLFKYSSLKIPYQYYAALTCMGVWALHPLNVSTVLYVVQRMAELSALFSLLAVISYLKGRETYFNKSQKKGLLQITLTTLPLIAFSFLSKENGATALLFILFLELTILNYPKQSPLLKWWLFVFIILPIIFIIFYFVFLWGGHSVYHYRNHTMSQHLMTEARILTDYLSLFFVPFINNMGVFHDDYVISKDLFTPITTLLSSLFIISLILFGFIKRKKYPYIAFGILWFFSGHILESSFIALEPYFEHRNYLPFVGLTIGVSYFLFATIPSILKRTKIIINFIIPIIILFFSFQTWSLATIWGNKSYQLALSHETHPFSTRATINYSNHLMQAGNPEKAISILQNSFHVRPNMNILYPYLTFYCAYYSKLPIDNKEIYEKVSQLHYKGVISSQVQAFTETVLGNSCISSPISFLDQMYTKLEENIYINYRKDDLARIYYLHSDIAHARGKLQKAISLLDKAYINQPTVDIASRQIDLLIKAKQYRIAMYYLEQAKKSNSNRKLFTADRKKEIQAIEKFLENKLKKIQ